MNLVICLILLILIVGEDIPGAYSTIRFDEVENPNKVLDESNEVSCAHLGEECQITPQCCGVTTCERPSWSEKPVCLVPGYKHDEEFRKRFFSLHSLRPEDIRYIRDAYNTSQYDFLLTDLTFSAPPLEIANSSIEERAANTSVFDETAVFGNIGRNLSEYSSSVEGIGGSNSTMNVFLEENYENETMGGANNNSSSISNKNLLDDSTLSNSNNSSNTSDIYNFDLKKHFKFLLVNSSLIDSDAGLNLKALFDEIITNTDRFKDIVEQLKVKMREITEKEKNNTNYGVIRNTTFPVDENMGTNTSTTEKTKITTKISKWNIVKKFFIHNREFPNNNFNVTSNTFINDTKYSVDPLKSKALNIQEGLRANQFPQNDYIIDQHDNDGFRKLIEDVDKIEEIIDSDKTINKFHEQKNVHDEGFDFYNINVPFDSFDRISEINKHKNISLESVFKDIGNTINSMIMRDDDKVKSKFDLVNDSTILSNNVENYSGGNSISNNSYTEKTNKTLSGTHFWDKIHFWGASNSKSPDMKSSLKHFFLHREKTNSSITLQPNQPSPLNEYFILNMNQQSKYKSVTPSPSEQIEQTSEYPYSSESSSDSEYSSSEELYNNSYVFMVHKQNSGEPVKLSSWKKLLNFFHREKVIPVSIDVKIHHVPPEISCNSENQPTEIGSESDQTIVEVPKIIRLPEYLMPQALEERQRNETDWIFEDSNDLEDGEIDENKSTNSSFFVFFKRFHIVN